MSTSLVKKPGPLPVHVMSDAGSTSMPERKSSDACTVSVTSPSWAARALAVNNQVTLSCPN